MEFEPSYTLTIPSIEDDTPLDCRVYHPADLNAALSDSRDQGSAKCAVIAHPYAPLGGCYDDPVVLSVVETLLGHGFIVGTFNFRYIDLMAISVILSRLTALEALQTRQVVLHGPARPSKETTCLS